MARKPIKLSIAKNCQQWGVGALNIDAGRVPYVSDADQPSGGENGWSRVGFGEQTVEKYSDQKKSTKPKPGTMGKAPPNLNAIGTPSEIETSDEPWIPSDLGRFHSYVVGDIPDYQKYFYCPKVGRAERHVGFDLTTIATNPDGMFEHGGGDLHAKQAEEKKNGNNHPTVKPIELMKYLIQLVTPPGGHVLDPFNGSGSTGCAAVELDYDYTGLELDPVYVAIAEKRIAAWHEATHSNKFAELFE
jgi:site-specific DNA-methyltransferase (adenine-specific)